MPVKMAVTTGLLVAALAVAAWAVVAFNRLVRLRNSVDRIWAKVKVVLTKRADLIPNLVNTVKGAANFEQEIILPLAEELVLGLGHNIAFVVFCQKF